MDFCFIKEKERYGATIYTIASRCTENSTTLDPYISQTIENMELITESKIIKNEIMDRIGVPKFIYII